MKKVFLIIALFISVEQLVSQSIPIFKWQDHLSYRSGVSVCEGGGKVFCATRGGIFVFNEGDNSMERLSKINGLSDVQATVVNYNSCNNKVFIAYSNANIDIVDGTTIINIPDIKNKNIVGNKAINNVYFVNQFAYISCGFGIVVLDMNRMEINDTYYIGPGGNAINVRDLTSDNTYFYAATDNGIYRASRNAPTLADNAAWNLITGVVNGTYSGTPNGKYNAITVFRGKVYANYSRYLYSNFATGVIYGFKDTVRVFDGVSWNFTVDSILPHSGYTCRELRTFNNKLVVVLDGQVKTFDNQLGGLYFGGGCCYYNGDDVRAEWSFMDNSGGMWFADDKYGLVSFRSVGFEYRYPNGPANEYVTNMSMAGGNLMVAPGGVSNSWSPLYIADGIFSYSNNNWSTINGNYPSVINMASTSDIMNVIIDTNDTKHTFAATWGEGLIELYDGVPIKHFDNTNSTLCGIGANCGYPIDMYGLALDATNNLWTTNSLSGTALHRKSASGTWKSIDFSSVLGNGGGYLSHILIDKNDQKWIVLARGTGLIVYAAGTTDAASVPANTKYLSTARGNGLLPSTNVQCLAEDKTGEIWVGTDKGITVFYSPENVFVPGQNFDSQQILLEQDGHVQILLLTELVQTIAVDDANRKWIGTANSGVYLMSADGTQQIYHFTESNSPLFSNDVRSIAIDHKTGEVYFGTSKGIIEFRGTSTEGNADFSEMYAFPNPVKPNYDGPIAIAGLMGNSTVKITDVVGNLVYQTTSEGGQALWYGKNFKGEKVSTGVYMVFCTNADGSQKAVTKILFIN